MALLVALSIAAVLVATTRTITNRSLDRAASDLDTARSAFYRLTDDRAEFASAQAALVTALPIFRSHMTDSQLAEDAATLEAMADGYRQQLRANFAIVANRAGRWTAAPGWPNGVVAPEALNALVGNATGRPSHDILPLAGGLYLVVSEPARFADELLGTLTVGYSLDDSTARRLAEVTHSEVNLIAEGRLVASSLAPPGRAALTALLARRDWPPPNAIPLVVQRIGADDFAVGAYLLPTTADRQAAALVLLQNWQPTRHFLDEIRRQLIVAGAGIFCVALVGVVVWSRRLSRPLTDLADAAEDIAAGNWSRQVAVGGSAEAILMAGAFNEMTTSLRHWYEEAKRGDTQLRQAQKMEAIGRLAGGVAHDFNNVLMAIKGNGQLLMEGLETSDQRRVDVEEILRATDRAAGLTRQLLAFARRQIDEPRILALDQIVLNLKPMLQRLIGEDVEIVTAFESPLGLVRADALQMDQVLINLAVNARDAMPRGGALRIEIASEHLTGPGGHNCLVPPGRYVRLSVSDAGCGMDQETLSHIFEPFFTTKAEGRGTGLGLATVYGIVDGAGGIIDVDTEPDRGTSFHIYLPQVSEAAAPLKSVAAPVRAEVARGSETILVVEDDRAVGTLICNGLRKAGYAVLEAGHGTQALEIMRTHPSPIDLLVTDVVMPGMNGRALSEHVTALQPGTRVLFMSGYSDDAMLRHGVKTASVRFIQKPFSVAELSARIREALSEGCSADPPAMAAR
ncbi:MAG TPA: ATP-binding protein [Vicinamibacterales bacterium]